MKIVVTGCAGFIGSHLTEALLARGDNVLGIDCLWRFGARRNMENFCFNKNFRFEFADVRSYSLTEGILTNYKPDVVVHLAALPGVQASLSSESLYYDVNLGGTRNILDILRRNGYGTRMILGSTSSVYAGGDKPSQEHERCFPKTPYAASKLAAEQCLYVHHHAHDRPATVLRFFTTYGPRNRSDMMVHKIADCVKHGYPVTLYDGAQRDWTYVDDIVSGIVATVDHPLKDWEIINLGYGQSNTLVAMATQLLEIAGVEDVSAFFTKYVAHENMPLKTEALINTADNTKAKQFFGWTPKVTLDVGLAKFWEWFKSEKS